MEGAALLSAILVIGAAIRLLGIGWGLPGQTIANEPPFHPDESHVHFVGGALYSNPSAIRLSWGGLLYFRFAYVAHRIAESGWDLPGSNELAESILMLRSVNVAISAATIILVAWIGQLLYGRSVGLIAAALMAFFPSHVLSSHFARPDVLLTFFCAGTLAFVCAAVKNGRNSPLLAGAGCAGLAVSTQLWGVVAVVPLVVAAGERELGSSRNVARFARFVFLLLPLGVLGGYLIGSFESFASFEFLVAGISRGTGMHAVESWRPPLEFATAVSFYAFGAVAALAAWIGLPLLALQRRPGSISLFAYVVAGWLLLGRVDQGMMRYLLFLSPAIAVVAALALVHLTNALTGRGRWRFAAIAAAVLFTLQLSLAYAWSMQFEEDPRYLAGDWLVRHAAPGSKIGFTRSFYGDSTYVPRLREEFEFELVPLMLRSNADASGYLRLPLDYIATSEFAMRHARGSTAPTFFRKLQETSRFRLASVFGPRCEPLSIARLMNLRPPGDLLYMRSKYLIFQRDE
jgi:hypothetical protein